ncbi:MAG: tRNA epoxyqueuosine(34) reductase QueG [Thiohalomonadales bacterium]
MASADINFHELARQIKSWSKQLGFQQLGICDTDLGEAEQHLQSWLKKQMHGEMHYMQKHGIKRSRPAELVAHTSRIISVRMDYFPPQSIPIEKLLKDPEQAFISRYALGRDYHKVLRKRLKRLAEKIVTHIGPYNYRVFTDSAPVMEKAIAEKSGLGWIGKHSNVINSDAGSWFFLGEIYTDLPLPIDQKSDNHCGSCQACLDICPTQAIIAPYQVDSRRCISYLTIELEGVIPVEYRAKMGSRIYGCDDCQWVCPWNKFSHDTLEKDFFTRHHLDNQSLIKLFQWDEATFLQKTEGSAIRRIGYRRWLRNIAVALGNAPTNPEVIRVLDAKKTYDDLIVREHVSWALERHIA